jgi:chromosome partitioning protein
MRTIAIANQKGGVGKTTTAINLSAGLARRGMRVLLIDLDPQANATAGLGLPEEEGTSLYHCLVGGEDVGSKIVLTGRERLHLIRADQSLAGAEVELARAGEHLARLRAVLVPLGASGRYDVVVLDCPPSLGILMTSALAAADEVIVPVQCEYFGLQGLTKIVEVQRMIRESGHNSGLLIEGILMTMYDQRTNLSGSVERDVREFFGETVYRTVIPRNVRLGEAPSHGQTIEEYDPEGKGALAYENLADEFIERHGGGNGVRVEGASSGGAGAAGVEVREYDRGF